MKIGPFIMAFICERFTSRKQKFNQDETVHAQVITPVRSNFGKTTCIVYVKADPKTGRGQTFIAEERTIESDGVDQKVWIIERTMS